MFLFYDHKDYAKASHSFPADPPCLCSIFNNNHCYWVAGQSTPTPESLGNTVPYKATTRKRIQALLPAGPTTICWTAIKISRQNSHHGSCGYSLLSKAHSFAPVAGWPWRRCGSVKRYHSLFLRYKWPYTASSCRTYALCVGCILGRGERRTVYACVPLGNPPQ